ncbi:MAG: hypothetical protein MUP93_06535, partial [Pirellulales bacterium]|nr:hypothetical protein [Pirellulales bacterium]
APSLCQRHNTEASCNQQTFSTALFLQLRLAKPTYFRIKNPFFRDLGRLRDFFHELYLTLSIPPLVSTSDRAGIHPRSPYFGLFIGEFLKTCSIPSILFPELGQN